MQPVLIINDTNRAPYTTEDGKGYLNVIISKVSQKANIKISLVRQPPERGLKNANSGQIDGDLTRIKKVGLLYPRLVRVEEKLLDWKFAAFSRNTSYISDWSMMKDHSVGYIKGWKIYENKTKDFKKTMIATNPEQLFRLLKLGRVDVVLYEKWQGLAIIKKLGLEGMKIKTSTVESKEMFIYLNKKHHKLAVKLSKIIKKLKSEGFYDKASKLLHPPLTPLRK